MPTLFKRENCDLLIELFGWSSSTAANKDSNNSSNDEITLKELKSMLAPFVLRRLKSDVLDQLVRKTVVVKKLPLLQDQSKIYEGLIAQYMERRAALNANSRNNSNKNTSSGNTETIDLVDLSEDNHEVPKETCDGLQVLTKTEAKHLFTTLRKAANHPLLLRVHYHDPKLIKKIAEFAYSQDYFGRECALQRAIDEIENNFSDFDIHQLCLQYSHALGNYILDASSLYQSPKMDYLRELLPTLKVIPSVQPVSFTYFVC
jgi:SWI/SNF-related matrix-associated actin-dependent regulator 1 of chromatin subfamily A